jgi:hypothetical protein
MILSRGALVGALVICSAAACKGEGAEAGSDAPAAVIDTTNNEPLDGSSSRQVQQQAEALTPEQAEARGMVDTTIHLENLSSSDSTPPGASTPGAPNPGAQAGARTDTVAPLPETNPGPQPAQGRP